MSTFRDFIPAGEDTGAIGNGKFADFVPTPVHVETVEAAPELVEAPKALIDYSKKELEAMATELGITDKAAFKNKQTLADAIQTAMTQPEETVEAAPEATVAPVEELGEPEAPVARIEDENVTIQ